MTELTQESLEAALRNIQAEMMLRGETTLRLKPTKLIMVPYPDESHEQFEQRCIVAKSLMGVLK